MSDGLCECGCGDVAKPGNRFIHGHHRRGVRSRTMGWTVEDRGFTSPCWMWSGYRQQHGYGVVSNGRSKKTVAHRAVYEEMVGPIPEGMELDHLCRQRGCVNPAHLEPVTRQENVLRGTSFAARNATKTECPKGHPYDETNTLIDTAGSRRCRACRRQQRVARKELSNA